MVDVKGKWTFITGAARGIGYGADAYVPVGIMEPEKLGWQ